MTIELPQPISTYFQADRIDGEAVSRCFTDAAVVIDEGKTHAGRAAICAWKTTVSNTFTYTVTPFAMAETAGKIIVTAHLVGNFPGSPVDLRYVFGLAGNKIASLEIKP